MSKLDIRKYFFSERVINKWTKLPEDFKRTLERRRKVEMDFLWTNCPPSPSGRILLWTWCGHTRWITRWISMFGQTEAPTKRGRPCHRTSDSSATFFDPWGPFYGVLRHSFGAARQSPAYKYYKTSEFRKPYLRSGSSRKIRTVVTLTLWLVFVR